MAVIGEPRSSPEVNVTTSAPSPAATFIAVGADGVPRGAASTVSLAAPAPGGIDGAELDGVDRGVGQRRRAGTGLGGDEERRTDRPADAGAPGGATIGRVLVSGDRAAPVAGGREADREGLVTGHDGTQCRRRRGGEHLDRLRSGGGAVPDTVHGAELQAVGDRVGEAADARTRPPANRCCSTCPGRGGTRTLMIAEPPLAGGVKRIDARCIAGVDGEDHRCARHGGGDAIGHGRGGAGAGAFNARISTGYSCPPVNAMAGSDEVVVMRSGLSVLPV